MPCRQPIYRAGSHRRLSVLSAFAVAADDAAAADHAPAATGAEAPMRVEEMWTEF